MWDGRETREPSEARRVLDRLGQAVLVLDPPEWAIRDSNAAATEFFGYPRDRLLGSRLDLLLPDADAFRHFREDAEEWLSRGEDVHRAAYPVRRSDGSSVDAEHTLTLLDPEHGPSGGLVLTVRDIHVRRSLEQRLVDAERMETVGRLAGGIAHDFNNLLTVVRANADLITREEDLPEAVRAFTDEIGDATRQATYIVRHLLAFSRRQVLEPRPIDLNETVRAIQRLLSRFLGENIDLELDLVASPPAVEADRGQVEQAIMNLALNAREAMPSGGTLTISTSMVELAGEDLERFPGTSPGTHVLLAVADTGEGMDEATAERAFEPFFTTREGRGGTGLGLASVEGTMDQSGGSLTLDTAPGEGTTVTLCFPATDLAPERRPDSEPVPPGAEGDETVLVVEDETAVLRVMRRMLERLGYNVLTARCAEEARKIVRERPSEVALMVTDLVLPDALGLELIETLHPEVPHLRFLVTSGYSGARPEDLRLHDVEVPFLPKPFSPEALGRKVREALEV